MENNVLFTLNRMLPNYQDKGYGSKLLSFIKEYSKEIGCSEMF